MHHAENMPMIQLRDVPENIYNALVERARDERRSLAQQAILTLARGLNVETDNRARRREVIRKIRAMDKTPYKGLSDPVKLIREDRER
jgi:hypothetical protein